MNANDRQARALGAYVKLMRAADSVQAELERSLSAEGFTEAQFGILEILLHLGPSSPGDLGRKMFRSGGNVTLVLDNLERDGLVRRNRDAADRRRIVVELTAEGRRRIRAAFPAHAVRIAALFAHLTAAEQDALARLARKLGLAVRAGTAPQKAGRRSG